MMTFQETQKQLADHLRNPQHNQAPKGLEDRRLQIYRDLIYNNIQGFIESGFPILRSITTDDAWHDLVREFIVKHQSHSPYFLEIGQEFLTYLQNHRQNREGDPEFMLELAHYEWVELALDVADEEISDLESGDLVANVPVVSPLVWCLSYQYPVHKIGRGFQPGEVPEQATFLVVYRNRQDKVRFMESNAVTHRLLQLLQSEEADTGREALLQIAQELQAPDQEAIVKMGAELLSQLAEKDIIIGIKANTSS